MFLAEDQVVRPRPMVSCDCRFRRDRRRVQTLQSGGRPVKHQVADTTTGAVDRNDNPTDSWPLEARYALALVARVTREVDEACDERRNLLLDDLMCAAWPTAAAQDQ